MLDGVEEGAPCQLTCISPSTQFQSNAALFEAVELQDLDRVQELLKQYSPEELDLNTPNSEGLLPLDIAIMTNNAPIARALLQAGAKESPHCELVRGFHAHHLSLQPGGLRHPRQWVLGREVVTGIWETGASCSRVSSGAVHLSGAQEWDTEGRMESWAGDLVSAEPKLDLITFSSLLLAAFLGPMAVPTHPTVVSLESRSLHLSTLVREAEQRVNELTAQVVNEAPSADCSEKEKQLKAWEWRYRLYKRMKAGFEHARECLQDGLGAWGAALALGGGAELCVVQARGCTSTRQASLTP